MQTRLKLRHLQALVSLYDLRSMGRAAHALGMTQPAMSQLVGDLEKLLETALFLRHSKGVDPTDATRDLMPVARRILAATEEAAERIASRQGLDVGVVRVGSTAAATGGLLDVCMPQFAQMQPSVRVQVMTVLGGSLDAAFAGDQYDLVCCRNREVLPDDWTFVPCIEDTLVPVCGARHPLATKKNVTLEDLRQVVWLQNHISTIARRHFDEIAAREGWTATQEIHFQSRASLPIYSMLRDGRYVSLVPRSVVAPWLNDGTLKEIDAELRVPLQPIGFHWRPLRAGQATRQLAELMMKQASIKGTDLP